MRVEGVRSISSAATRIQGYLTRKKHPPPPQGHHRSLGIVLLWGPRGVLLDLVVEDVEPVVGDLV